MRLTEFGLLADENLHPEVVRTLRRQGRDIVPVQDRGLSGHDDSDILRHAVLESRLVVTHDRDFGALAIRAGQAYVGIVYLRPGHNEPEIVLRMLDVLWATVEYVETPFVIVVERRIDTIRVRLRKVP